MAQDTIPLTCTARFCLLKQIHRGIPPAPLPASNIGRRAGHCSACTKEGGADRTLGKFTKFFRIAWRENDGHGMGGAIHKYTHSPPTLEEATADMVKAKCGKGVLVDPPRVRILLHMMGCRWVGWGENMELPHLNDDRICAPCLCTSPMPHGKAPTLCAACLRFVRRPAPPLQRRGVPPAPRMVV